MNILFVENHRVFADTVTAEFLHDHAVTLVATVMEALDLYRGGSFDAVLADYDLDDFKGDALVRRLRALDPGIPIIAVSARDEGNAALLAAGANAVCHKAAFRTIGDVLARVAAEAVH